MNDFQRLKKIFLRPWSFSCSYCFYAIRVQIADFKFESHEMMMNRIRRVKWRPNSIQPKRPRKRPTAARAIFSWRQQQRFEIIDTFTMGI
jgi:hypothetical protein